MANELRDKKRSILSGILERVKKGIERGIYLFMGGDMGKLKRFYAQQLPYGIMGRNHKIAMDNVSEFLDKGNFIGARRYVKSQLEKILEQVRGTQSEGNIRQRLEKYKNIH